MKRRGLQLSRRHKAMLYVISLVLLFSGVFWAWFHHLDETAKRGDFLRSLNPWLMKIHGFAAVGFVLLLGTLLPVHVRHSWHAHKNRTNGAFFLAAIGLLSLSGYSLYYLGDERVRGACSTFHLWLGVLSPALLIAHIWFGRRATSK
jgi:cation transport ATPase